MWLGHILGPYDESHELQTKILDLIFHILQYTNLYLHLVSLVMCERGTDVLKHIACIFFLAFSCVSQSVVFIASVILQESVLQKVVNATNEYPALWLLYIGLLVLLVHFVLVFCRKPSSKSKQTQVNQCFSIS